MSRQKSEQFLKSALRPGAADRCKGESFTFLFGKVLVAALPSILVALVRGEVVSLRRPLLHTVVAHLHAARAPLAGRGRARSGDGEQECGQSSEHVEHVAAGHSSGSVKCSKVKSISPRQSSAFKRLWSIMAPV